jgi:hypothetical protein
MRSKLLAGMLLMLVLGVVAASQEITATILGTVRDVSGAAVGNATITVTNEGTGVSRTVKSDADGNYLVSLLPVGSYTVKVEKEGFTTHVQKGIVLVVNQNARVDAALKPGSVQESVIVESNAAQIETTSSTIGKVMEEESITQLPLNGRNYLQLGVLQPGVAPITTNLAKSGSAAAADEGFAVNGLRTQANVFLVDGALNTDLFFTASNLRPPPDAIQEFKILTNSYEPEYWGGGSVVNLVIRTGTNQYHGQAWEFLRNDIFDAKNFFATLHPPLKQNQFGGGVGGPVRIPKLYDGRNKTFFYAYYDGFRNRQGMTSATTVPPTAEAGGNFNGVSPPPHQPGTSQPFPGNQVPVNPIAAKLLALYPTSATGAFSASPSQSEDHDGFGVRVDQHFGDHDTLWGHYLYNRIREVLPFAPFGAVVPGFPGTANDTPQTITIGETHIFSSRLLSDLHLSYVRTNFANPVFTRRDNLTDFGFQYASTFPSYETIPFISITGFSALGNPQGPGIRFTNTYELREAVGYTTGRHNVKVGLDVRNTRYNILFGSGENGSYSFTGQFTGYALADFELGLPASFTQSTVGFGHLKGWTYEWYAQDDWRLLSNLTLSLGLRHTMATAFSAAATDLFGAFRLGEKSTLRPDAPTNLVYQGDPGVPSGTVPGDYNNVAPRIGLAWDPTGKGKWSIRAGFGMFYEYVPGIAQFNAEFSSPPGFPSFTIFDPTNFANPLVGMPNPFQGSKITTPVSLTSLAPNLHLPYDEQWNLSVQRELPGDVLIEADYIGTRGVGLIRTRQINPAVFGPGATTKNTNARRIYAPNFASVSQIENSASSDYHALQLSANKRFSHGLTFLASYTFSKAIDNGSYYNISQGTNAGNSNQPMNPFDLALEKGLSLYDVRNRFVASGVYQLPFGRSLTGFAGVLAKGWASNFIITVQSGTPFTVQEPVDISLTGVGADRPNVICNPNSGPHTVAEWFNINCFQRLSATTNAGQYGNEGRDIVIGPPYRDFDFAVTKDFPIREAFGMQFRAEFFNIFNHPNFNLPNLTEGPAPPTGSFGSIQSALDPRILQFSLKLHF